MEVINQPEHQDEHLNTLLQNGYKVDGSRYIDEAFQLFKKNVGYFIGYTLILGIASSIIYRVNPNISGALDLFSAIFTAGFYIVAAKLDRDEGVEFSDFFRGLNNFIPLFLGGALASIFTAIGFVLLVIPGIYLAVAYLFIIPFIVFKGMDFWPAMETSRKLITKEWFSVFIFCLLLLLINILGALLIGIGLLVSVPVTFIAIYQAYKDIVLQGEVPKSRIG